MFNDENFPVKKNVSFPRPLDEMSLAELQDYIHDLEEEIERVKDNMRRKKASHDVADDFFK